MDSRQRCSPAKGTRMGAAIASTLFVVLTSCAKSESPPAVATTTTTGARMLMNDDAAMRVTKARCQNEDACGRVGSARRFADPDSCTREMFDEAWVVVRDETCPAGVDEGRLATCIADARNQPCEQSRRLGELDSCRAAALCATP